MTARDPALVAGVELFNRARFLAAHEAFEEPWEANESGDADFFKGLIQATIALHKLAGGHVDGALQLYRGHRRFLGAYLPVHRGLDVAAFLDDMQTFFRPLLVDPETPPADEWPRLAWASGSPLDLEA
ncbi:MAG: DUF309 domain-containing protein [Planctomycetota bacterium]